MKGKIALQILELIGETAADAIDIAAAIITSPYRGADFTQQRSLFIHLKSKRARNKERYKTYCKLMKRYHNTVAWLKYDGIIKELIVKDNRFFSITKKGAKYKKILIKRQEDEPPPLHYIKKRGGELVVVAFDIPQKEDRKRTWLRKALISIGLGMIQKSVWIGHSQIPEEFIADLRHLKILDYVEIFKVTKSGSLRRATSK